MPEQPFLQIDKLDAGYGGSQILFGVDIVIPRQGAVAILGRNGAGKTTLMKTIMGELEVRGGGLRF
ncbi:MAG: ATP-binding cassette domain-containing protein, partial [Rhizobiales bacterium]|nr:ATP-binding cassette domain-containing protein [Hyphomicrobiales bacterium]